MVKARLVFCKKVYAFVDVEESTKDKIINKFQYGLYDDEELCSSSFMFPDDDWELDHINWLEGEDK